MVSVLVISQRKFTINHSEALVKKFGAMGAHGAGRKDIRYQGGERLLLSKLGI